MKFKTSVRENIETVAQIVREGLELQIPIDIRKAIEELGGEYVESDTDDYDAKIEVIGNNRFSITCSCNQSRERLRFSISHELGHLFLHILQADGTLRQNAQYNRSKNSTNNNVEWEANEFAASFLMPKREFVGFCYNNKKLDNTISIQTVAKHFGVLVQATDVRGEY